MKHHKKVNHLAAVVTCVGYADILRETLHQNLPHLDDLVVVTSYDDTQTQQVCGRFNVTCVPTDVMHRDGAAFNKGAAINVGLSRLEIRDWALHLDADIALPPTFRRQIELERLDTNSIYGCDRVDVKGAEVWDTHLASGHRQHSHSLFVTPPAHMPVGGRVIHSQWGYVPIGFFQLWHLSAHKQYPFNSPNAERTDMTFAMQWSANHRRHLTSAWVYHLMSDPSGNPMGCDWSGRKSPPFRAEKPYGEGSQ
jgi:hypothetical protein